MAQAKTILLNQIAEEMNKIVEFDNGIKALWAEMEEATASESVSWAERVVKCIKDLKALKEASQSKITLLQSLADQCD